MTVRLLPLLPDPDPVADDDQTYIRDHGRLVLAEWDAEGRLVAAELLPAAYLACEIPARGWQLRPHGRDICHVVRLWPAVTGYPAATEECRRPAEHGDLCRKCFEALRTPA